MQVFDLHSWNLCFIWPPTCINLHWLWSSSNLHTSWCKFFPLLATQCKFCNLHWPVCLFGQGLTDTMNKLKKVVISSVVTVGPQETMKSPGLSSVSILLLTNVWSICHHEIASLGNSGHKADLTQQSSHPVALFLQHLSQLLVVRLISTKKRNLSLKTFCHRLLEGKGNVLSLLQVKICLEWRYTCTVAALYWTNNQTWRNSF